MPWLAIRMLQAFVWVLARSVLSFRSWTCRRCRSHFACAFIINFRFIGNDTGILHTLHSSFCHLLAPTPLFLQVLWLKGLDRLNRSSLNVNKHINLAPMLKPCNKTHVNHSIDVGQKCYIKTGCFYRCSQSKFTIYAPLIYVKNWWKLSCILRENMAI